MHYMVARRMFFVDGWPILSPQPYAGEKGEACRLDEYLYRKKSDETVRWEWLRLKQQDNRQVLAAYGLLPQDLLPERTLVFDSFDFENSREGTGLAGITTGGEIIWGKRIMAASEAELH